MNNKTNTLINRLLNQQVGRYSLGRKTLTDRATCLAVVIKLGEVYDLAIRPGTKGTWTVLNIMNDNIGLRAYSSYIEAVDAALESKADDILKGY